MLRGNRVVGGSGAVSKVVAAASEMPRHFVIGMILITALFAFEMFNFDTTRYALESLLGDVRFVGLAWATILAVAFCAIDFAGLARLFTPEKGRDEPKEIWYLTGAWLLGATMNALMTWWAVSLTLLNHDLGNEVLTREELLKVVPVFVALLVWLTRILFIGAVTAAGERILHGRPASRPLSPVRDSAPSRPRSGVERPSNRQGKGEVAGGGVPDRLEPTRPASNRVRQRPPRPAAGSTRRLGYNGVQASQRRIR